MIITEKYSSYVFLGELITDAVLPSEANEIKYCMGCKKCISECPKNEESECLSAITQKKGELNENEIALMQKHYTAWGCDICQKVCPYTEKAIRSKTIFTDIEYFLTDIIPDLSSDILNALNDDDFSLRAFSWRGRSVVARNLKILEKNYK